MAQKSGAPDVLTRQAKTAIAPLDRVKILFQADSPEFQKYSGRWLGVLHAGQRLVRSGGVFALFQGHSATLLRIFPYAAIKYMAYDLMHGLLMPNRGDETSFRLFLAGSSSGVLSVFVTYPLELIRVRLAFDTNQRPHPGSLRSTILKIYREGSSTDGTGTQPRTMLSRYPILKFYRGFSATVLGMVPYAGTSFLVFGRCKTLMYSLFHVHDRHGNLVDANEPIFRWRVNRTVVDLCSGALAGAIAQTAAYPLEVVRRRQQVGGILRPGSTYRVLETARWIYQAYGLRGFFVGLGIGYMKVVPMTAISFTVWLDMKRRLGI